MSACLHERADDDGESAQTWGRSIARASVAVASAVISPFVLARIGSRFARQVFVTGERFEAPRAYEIGLVDRVLPDVESLDAAIGEIVDNIPIEEATSANRDTSNKTFSLIMTRKPNVDTYHKKTWIFLIE